MRARDLILLAGLVLWELADQSSTNALHGQSGAWNRSVPSPTAASLGKFGDVPVSLYTGVPQIIVPLFTASGKTLELPIALAYHASGIKLEEIGGWVGMGWSLQAGGAITRTVRFWPRGL